MMNLPGQTSLPVASLQPVANLKQHWVAVLCNLPPQASGNDLLPLLSSDRNLLDACGKLPLLLRCADPLGLNSVDIERLPPGRLLLCLPASRCRSANLESQLRQLQASGARFLLEGCIPPELKLPSQINACIFDVSHGVLPLVQESLQKLPGPHLALHVDSQSRLEECRQAGFAWVCGDYALQPGSGKSEATSRSRLLKLLAMVARDADARELEALLKQDVGLSFHLLKLVNSAAFAPSTPITSFTQAINVLGRRQLQRWLQLLLYARTDDSGTANPLLPLAALRASLMESLCQAQGGNAEEREKAFMVGMFSLLPAVVVGALEEVVTAMKLDADIIAALLNGSGMLGSLLRFTDAATRGRDLPDAAGLGFSSTDYWQAMTQAWRWAGVVMQEA